MYIFQKTDNCYIAYLEKEDMLKLLHKEIGINFILDFSKPDASHTYKNCFEVAEVLEFNKRFLTKIQFKNNEVGRWIKKTCADFEVLIVNSFEDCNFHFDYTTNKAFYDFSKNNSNIDIESTDTDWYSFLFTVFSNCEYTAKWYAYNYIVKNGIKEFEDESSEIYKFKNCLIETISDFGCVNFKVSKYE